MERGLPTYMLHGTPFIVDVKGDKLVEKTNRENTISFGDMLDTGNGYQISYDVSTKNMPQSLAFEQSDVRLTIIPYLTQLDPEGMAEKYNVPLAEIAGKTDFEVIVDQQFFQERALGRLPQIDIAGKMFFVDIRLSEIRLIDHLFSRLDLSEMDVTPDGEFFLCYYNTRTREVVEAESSLKKLPKNVVELKIPNELKLDPYHIARTYGADFRTFLRNYPPSRELKAIVTPLENTIWGELYRKQEARVSKTAKKGQNRAKKKPPGR